MSRKRKKRHTGKVLIVCVVLAAAGFAVYKYQFEDNIKTQETEVSYKEETVKLGSVTSGITESGTVTFGSKEQDFSLAELISVSSSSSSDSSSGDSAASGAQTSAMGGMSAMGATGMQMGGSTGSSGSGSSSNSTSVSADTGLDVEELYVAAGQVVSAGDAILKFSQDSIDAYREELEATVASAQLLVTQEEINVESKRAEADYTYDMYIAKGKTAKETYDATITSLENDVTDLEEELAEAAEEVAELQEEYDAGYDVEDDLEEAELNYSTIEANLQIAKNTLTTQSIEAKQTYENAMTNYQYADKLYEIDTNGLEDDLNDAKDTLADAEEALAAFEEQIGDGVVYSEYSGTISEVGCAVGDTLTDGSVVATFADSDDVTMTASVSQEDISAISVGDAVSIELTAYKDEVFEAEVTSIATSTSMGSSTVNYDVTVRFTGDITKVYSGMSGEVTFVEKQETDTLYISNKAVHLDGTRSWVKVLEDDGTITETTIETGFSNGSKVAVLSGLSEGQTVLIESQVVQ